MVDLIKDYEAMDYDLVDEYKTPLITGLGIYMTIILIIFLIQFQQYRTNKTSP